jgi:hypothetical protein
VHDHQAHEQGVDAVLRGEPEGDRGDDGHGGRAHRSDRGQDGRDAEHDPGDRDDAPADAAYGQPDEPVHRPVLLGDGEEVGDADQRQEQITGKAREDVVRGQVRDVDADQERRREGDRPHVHRQQGGHDEHRHQHED